MDWKIELVPIPVTDVDRAKEFYVDKIGFHADYDERPNEGLRFVQLTPPGSACSIYLGEGLTDMTPGSQHGVQIVVGSAQDAYDELTSRGVEVRGVEDLGWGKFVFFSDPDGNQWSLQELPPRPPDEGTES